MDPINTLAVPNDHVMANTQEQMSDAPSTDSAMSTNPLPVNLYETLLLKLVTVLQLTHQNEGTTTPAAKQTILQAVSPKLDVTMTWELT